MTPSAQRITVCAEVLFRIVGDEAVLLNLRTERYLGLDAIGTRMWVALSEAPSIEEACRVLLDEYDVGADRLRIDLDEFIAALIDHGLVEIAAA